MDKLLAGQKLEAKYKDHQLKGKLKDFRDCHVRPDLVLIYSINNENLILNAFRINSHSEIF
ncbi:MAG: type II toxin-antitoxin system YafQ family toxin [Spirochaetia bacterium]|nr:type II toxin-antitoxin system YafQ family toxin [Spirochaetia bacterium]